MLVDDLAAGMTFYNSCSRTYMASPVYGFVHGLEDDSAVCIFSRSLDACTRKASHLYGFGNGSQGFVLLSSLPRSLESYMGKEIVLREPVGACERSHCF